MNPSVVVRDEVAEALSSGRPVVALETSVVAQGLPTPLGLEAALACMAAVRRSDAVPAVVAVLAGRLVVGASENEVARLADPARKALKAATRDLGPLSLTERDAGTTVSATVFAAGWVGIPVVATGGIGGVHRVVEGEASRWAGDVSADLPELARTPVCVVCAGPKAILDLSATAELLETLGVPIVGYRTGELPAFYCDSSGIALEHRVDSAAEAARMLHAVRELGRGMLLAVAPPEPLSVALVEGAIKEALREARTKGIHGKALTPFLLAAVARATGGEALKANVALLEKNAQVAGEVAAAYPKCG